MLSKVETIYDVSFSLTFMNIESSLLQLSSANNILSSSGLQVFIF